MAENKKISELSLCADVKGEEYIPVSSDGANYRVKAKDIAELSGGGSLPYLKATAGECTMPADAVENSSVALGYMSTAKGGNSTAVGYGACATYDAVAVGHKSYALDFSVAYGADSVACCVYSTAIGYCSSAGSCSAAVGYESRAYLDSVSIGAQASSYNYGVAIGEASCSNTNSVSIGTQAYSDIGGVAIGEASCSSANSVSIGTQAYSDIGGVAIGDNAESFYQGGVAIGAFSSTMCYGGVSVISALDLPCGFNNRTQLYLIAGESELANRYTYGEAGLGFTVDDGYGNILRSGVRKLSELLTHEFLQSDATDCHCC